MRKFIALAFIAIISNANTDVCDSADMRQMVSELNSKIPLKVDDEANIVYVGCTNGELVYNVLLVGETFYKLSTKEKEGLKKLRYENLEQFYCHKLTALREDTRSITWSYLQKDGTKFHDFKFTPNKCR